MALDLGAVGKGYAASLVAEVLAEHDVTSALVNLGGNVQAVGHRPDGRDWRIGVRAPWEDENLGVLEISDAAVVTSGGYENYFEDAEGNLYWHILDPATGRPADSGLPGRYDRRRRRRPVRRPFHCLVCDGSGKGGEILAGKRRLRYAVGYRRK